jgi:hypothetical protein
MVHTAFDRVHLRNNSEGCGLDETDQVMKLDFSSTTACTMSVLAPASDETAPRGVLSAVLNHLALSSRPSLYPTCALTDPYTPESIHCETGWPHEALPAAVTVMVSVPSELELEKTSILSIRQSRQKVTPPGTPAIRATGDMILLPESGTGKEIWILFVSWIVSVTTGGSEILDALWGAIIETTSLVTVCFWVFDRRPRLDDLLAVIRLR